MEHIVLDRIPHKKIREFIQTQLNNNVKSVKDLQASYQHGDYMDDLNQHEESYVANFNINEVWDFYNKTGPNTVFRKKLVSFALMLSKRNESEVLYKEEPFLGTEIGQVYFMNLTVFGGLVQLAVSYEIVEINEKEKFFEFSYVKGGKSIGMQRITFESMGENQTKITHKTHYKSESKFRDRFVYPYFHTKVLEEYHLNMIDFMGKRVG